MKKGGKVIASGGFGCVFKPSLKCKGKNREKGKITKLMTERHALSEYNEIKLIKNKLDNIPNYKNYFMIDDFQICIPDKLENSDLKNYKKKCSALPKDDITFKNINKSLDKLMALNMPDGGVPVDDYIYNNTSFKEIYELNKSLIDLFINGILPMNKKNIYHCDIKDSNVLVKAQDDQIYTRLIDWGLSTEYTPFIYEKFPKTWRNRPLQYNVPFSVILFTDSFGLSYKDFIDKEKKIDETTIRPFVIDYIYFWMKKRGNGHYKFINDIMYMLFSNELQNIPDKDKNKLIETDFTMRYIINYLTKILLNYTNFNEDGTINLIPYLDEVFINIVDVWGFIFIYYPILEFLYDNYSKLDENKIQMFNLIKNIIINNLYNPRIEPINIKNLVKDLEMLGELFKIEYLNNNIPNKILENKIYKNNSTIKTKITKNNKSIKMRQKKYTFKNKISKLIIKKNTKTGARKAKTYLFTQKN
jgi:hypothetical protein